MRRRNASIGKFYGSSLNHFDALHLLGVIALQTRHPERAVELIGKAIALKPNYAAAYTNRGKALNDMSVLRKR